MLIRGKRQQKPLSRSSHTQMVRADIFITSVFTNRLGIGRIMLDVTILNIERST